MKNNLSHVRKSALIFAGFVVGMGVGGTGIAGAASVVSSVGDLGIHSGFHFRNQAAAYDTGTAYTGTWVDGSTNAPTGYLGSEGRLFKSSGAMCRTSGMTYSSSPAIVYYAGASRGSCSAGYYYSYGKSGAWDGGGYSYYYTYKSPNIYMG